MPEQQPPTREVLDIIKEIERTSSITQRTLSGKLGISLGKINYLLRALTEKGLIKLKRFKNSSNKIGYLYVLTPLGIKKRAEITKSFLHLKLEEYERLRDEIRDLRREVSPDLIASAIYLAP